MDPVLMGLEVLHAGVKQAATLFHQQIEDAIPNEPRIKKGAEIALELVEVLIDATEDDAGSDLASVRDALQRRING